MKSDFRPKHLQCEFRLIPLTYNFMIGWIKKTLQKSQVRDNWPSINWAHYDDICAVELFCCRQDGSCLLWVMSTEISVDIAVDTRSIVGRHLVDSQSILGRRSVDTRSTLARHSVDITHSKQDLTTQV